MKYGPRRLFNFIGTVYVSFNDRGRQVIVELTLAGTLTTPPEIFNCPPPFGSSRNCMKQMRGAPSHSLSEVNSSACGLTGNDILFAFAQQGNLPRSKFESHVRQIHSIFPTLSTPVTTELTILGQQLE